MATYLDSPAREVKNSGRGDQRKWMRGSEHKKVEDSGRGKDSGRAVATVVSFSLIETTYRAPRVVFCVSAMKYLFSKVAHILQYMRDLSNNYVHKWTKP
jgi:hypothetical protein